MNTTALFVEMLIIGIQTSIWIGLFLASGLFLSGSARMPSPEFTDILRDWSNLIIAIYLVGAYTLGIIVDQVAGVFLQRKDQVRLYGVLYCRSFAKVMYKLHTDKPDANGYLYGAPITEVIKYIRSRIRIIRSTVINLPMILVAATTLFIMVRPMVKPRVMEVLLPCYLVGMTIGILFLVMTLVCLAVLQHAYKNRKRQAKAVLKQPGCWIWKKEIEK